MGNGLLTGGTLMTNSSGKMEQGHTPGPWRTSHNNEDKLSVRDYKDNQLCVVAYSQPTPTHLANAALIAAAPMLLEACRQAVECIKYAETNAQKQIPLQVLEEAIQAAEGRG